MSLYMNGIAHTAGQMKKIKKQTSVTPVRSVTPVSQVCYVLLCERHSSYRRMVEKIKKQTPVTSVRSVTSVSRVRSVFLYERYNSYCRTNEKMKNSHPQVQHVQQVQHVRVLKLVTSHVEDFKNSPFFKGGYRRSVGQGGCPPDKGFTLRGSP